MFNYIIKRLIVMFITLFGITVITFVITRLAPGDPAALKLQFAGKTGRGGSQLSKKLIEETRKIYGFDKPIILNFRNENYITETEKLLKILSNGDTLDKEDARLTLREVSTLTLPTIFHSLSNIPQNRISEDDEYKNEIIELLPTLIHPSLLPDEIKNLSAIDNDAKIKLWIDWWSSNKQFFENINKEKIDEALALDNTQKREEIFLSYGGYAVKYLVEIILNSNPAKIQKGDIKAVRAAEALSLIVKKTWSLDSTKTKSEQIANFDKWKRWWRTEKVRFCKFSPTQKLFRIITATQFGIWMGKIIRLDFDISYNYNRPVIQLIKERLPISLQLSIISIFLSYIIAIPIGIFSSTHRNTFADQIITVILFILYSLPSFWIASMLIMFTTGGDFPHLFPARYLHSIGYESFPFWKRTVDWLWHLVLPITCYTYGSFAFLSRQMRTSMLNVIKEDFIRTARAKGLPEHIVIFKHALRNSLIPILTLSAVILPELLGGSVIIEQIFSIDGMGKLTFEAILNRDYPVINGIFFFSAFLTLLGILIADLSYALADPRIKYD